MLLRLVGSINEIKPPHDDLLMTEFTNFLQSLTYQNILFVFSDISLLLCIQKLKHILYLVIFCKTQNLLTFLVQQLSYFVIYLVR